MLSMELAMLTKAHLISHYRMFGSRWVITPLCLFRSLKPFLYSSVVYSCDLFCFCYVHTISVLIVPIYTLNIPLVSLIFLKRSLVFPILLFPSISLHCSLKKMCVCVCVCVWVAQFSLILCDPVDCSLPGSSVHGNLQARILEWVAISSSRRSS